MTSSDRKQQIEEQIKNTVLTELEIEEALRERKIKKIFHERNKDKWPEEERRNRAGTRLTRFKN